jgi:hypothetical protein
MPLLLPIWIRPTSQPWRSTPGMSTPREGRQTHPRRHDTITPEESTWPTTSLSVISPSPEKSTTRSSPNTENTKHLRNNYPILFSLLRQYTSPCLCINFTMVKCHNMTGHPWPYPDTRGLLGLRSTDRCLITIPMRLETAFISFFPLKKVWGPIAITHVMSPTSTWKKEDGVRSNHL